MVNLPKNEDAVSLPNSSGSDAAHDSSVMLLHRTIIFIRIAIIAVAIVDIHPIIHCATTAFSIHVDGGGSSPPSSGAVTTTLINPPSSPKKKIMTTTFYRRVLPSTAISFSSSEGRAIFASAMAGGGTNSFFPLIEQL